MAIEIEAKMRLDDVASLQGQLQSLGAQHIHTILEVNTFFDTPQHTLQISDQGLRLRTEQELDGPHRQAILTHKGPRLPGTLKSRPETQVVLGVDHVQAAAELLTALGYQRTFTFEKKRSHWTLDDCCVDIDRLPYLGDYVEIEGPSEEAVLAVRQKLQLDQTPLIHESYIALLTAYLGEHHLDDNHICLE